MVVATRLETANGLSSFLKANVKTDASNSFFFFDFDRTLTNGYEFSENEKRAPIEKRIRGGNETLTTLTELFRHGAHFHIITARSAKTAVLDQLKASLKNSQNELEALFPTDGNGTVEEFHGINLAHVGSIYASGYQKEMAIAHSILHKSNLPEGPIRVFFFDDAVSNCHAVAENLHKLFKTPEEKEILDRIELSVCWWDPFREETEVDGEPTMIAVHSEDTDFSYHDYLGNALKMFGVDEKERSRVESIYKAEEKKYGRKAPSTLVEKPPEAKPLQNLDKKFANLGALFGPRG
mmetsp:Transcript_16223/g.18365  ORF Transcript_16223/g.18365 Transcript_16223/m.18365 type:complete len:294 (+) Transcript_16223:76-957(+)